MTSSIDSERLAALKAREDADFVERHPRSRELFERAQAHLLDGVPMNWMMRWAGPFPLFVAEAQGAHFTYVDGHDYVDFCLGDTGAMTGHAPAPSVEAIAEQPAAASPSCCRPRIRSGWPRSWRAASACPTGRWR